MRAAQTVFAVPGTSAPAEAAGRGGVQRIVGQGLSIAVGMALAGKLDHEEHTVFCIMGDGEQQEGSIWEAAMEASHTSSTTWSASSIATACRSMAGSRT